DNLGAMKLKLSDDEMARLNDVSAPQPLDYPYGKGGINQRHRKIEGGR
ncbi:aldo/keto reductase, partial [Rhizobium leguminosarum]